MKMLLVAAILPFTFSAFAANVDALLGTYKAKDGDGKAVISKTLISGRTYYYEVHISRKKHFLTTSLPLNIDPGGNSLSAHRVDDCDDPDCYALDLRAQVKKVGQKAQLSVQYDGYSTEDESDEVHSFKGSAVFIKP